MSDVGWLLHIAQQEGCDAMEAAFLRAIVEDPEDDATRSAYADWLEESGCSDKARYVHLELGLHREPRISGRFETLRAEQEDLRASLIGGEQFMLAWTDGLKRPARIMNCGRAEGETPTLRFVFECPNRWQDMKSTASPKVRYCEGCKKNVHACDTKEEAEEHAWGGRCVAISSRLALTVLADPIPDEVESGYEMAGMLLPPDWAWGEDLFSRKPKPKPKPWWHFW